MNKLQRYMIVHGQAKDPALPNVQVIGTNSGQAFVEAAAEKHAQRLRDRNGGHYHVVEITKLKDLI